jgi:hypothetical protein
VRAHIHIEHGGYADKSRAELVVNRGLASGRLDYVWLEPDDLLTLAQEALKAYQILKDKP